MFTKAFTTLLAISASAWAYTTPTTFNVTSNPVGTPNTADIVPVGKPFEITWQPTESGTVTILLLRGPSTNILPLYPIVEKIPNTGSYKWTPKTDLEPDTTHYGIQIIIDANGQYQYSTQFGVANPNYEPPTSSSVSSSAAATSAAPTTTDSYGSEETTTSYETVYTTTKSSVTSFITVTTSSIPYEESTTAITTPTYVAPTETYTPPANNGTTYAPTGTSQPTISSVLPPVPSQTGAASSIKVASGLLVGVAGVAAMLL